MKKIIVPIVLSVVILIYILVSLVGESNKISLKVTSGVETNVNPVPDSVVLKVYVENSGSMDGYMCAGSELKDAVFDYISDVRKYAKACELYYVNSQIVRYHNSLDSYIKDLTPSSFVQAGGNRANTDLREILKMVLNAHQSNTISIFISDCILDIPQGAKGFFGNCQISIKNAFDETLQRIPTLGVEIAQLQSKFDGYWYCGKEKEVLTDAKRPYYIWVIGDMRLLAKMNKKTPLSKVIHGITHYCAYAPVKGLPCAVEKATYVVNHRNVIDVELLADLGMTLQDDHVVGNPSQFSMKKAEQVEIVSVLPISYEGSKYTHVLNMQISNPKTLKDDIITFNYPYLPSWVESVNDDTGKNVKGNLDKTTGIKYLITGIAEAYKDYTSCGNFELTLKNK